MPLLYGRFVKDMLFPLNEKREGTHILGALRGFEQSQYWSRDQLHEWQWSRLRLLLAHAYNNTGFYRRRFDEIGFHPQDIKDYADFQKLPILTKQNLRSDSNELIAGNYSEGEIHESTTGGTTADYTVFYRDNKGLDFKLASTIRHDRWCGWDIGEKEAIIWPASIDFEDKVALKSTIRNRLLDRKLRIFAGVLNEEIVKDICDRLQRFKPALIRGFPNPISIIAEFIKANPEYHIRPTAIKSVGEALSTNALELFESVFQCKVFNYYLSRESGTIASECEQHDKMHINAECLFVEFLRNGKPVEYGDPGDIVITDLYNFGMPFIRYQIGDIGAPVKGSCACRRNLPLMDMTAGRESDFLISPLDGSFIMGLSLLVPFVENPKVGQLQVIQDKKDHITLRIAKNEDFEKENLTIFKRTVQNMFQGTMSVSFEFVDNIPHDKSGKYRFAIRKDF